jgi:tRNA (guanine26-N2/guanine27-N2)-dimethyltransferase
MQVCALFTETLLKERAVKRREHQADSPTYNKLSSTAVRLLDCSTTSGLRSLRYMKEVPDLTHVSINCPDHDKVEDLERNIKQQSPRGVKVDVTNVNSRMALYQAIDDPYDIVEVEPTKAAESHFDGAVQAVADGGLLCISVADMPTLRGFRPEVCYARYGSLSVTAPYDPELALRILLRAVDGAANRHRRFIVPWLSVFSNNYIRLYVRVYESSAMLLFNVTKSMFVLQSAACSTFKTIPVGLLAAESAVVEVPEPVQLIGNVAPVSPGINGQAANQLGRNVLYEAVRWSLPEVCEESGGQWKVVGPVWAGRLHDPAVASELYRRLQFELGASNSNLRQGKYANHHNENRGAHGNSDEPPEVEAAVRASQAQLLRLMFEISTELPDAPLFYSMRSLTADIDGPCILSYYDLMSALAHAGYKASGFHADEQAVKTDAPSSVVSTRRCAGWLLTW